MSFTAMFVIDREHITEGFQDVQSRLDGSGTAVLDFSSVSRMQSRDLVALEELLKVADDRGIRVQLHGVNVVIYKVLKLAKLASRFGFLA